MIKHAKRISILLTACFILVVVLTIGSFAGGKIDLWKSVGEAQANIIKKDSGESVAIVNGVGISTKTYEMAKSLQTVENSTKKDSDILDELIQNELLYQDAIKQGYSASEDEIDVFISDQRKSIRVDNDRMEQMLEYWTALGVTEDEYYEMVTPIIERIIVKGKRRTDMQSQFNKEHESLSSQEKKEKFKSLYNEYKETLRSEAKVELLTK